ncbi:hypothetical protein [Flavobacterium sp.]|uniref:hypothetical protein n=1 Tax=Flavobacterium sp. TaxID=239 RepID=UPI00262657D8|nr:hypothetical protein [Flavobacterium sp.]
MENFYDKYEFFPLTILDTPLETAKAEIEGIIRNWWGDIKIEKGAVNLDKVNPPPKITPGGAHFTKILIWTPINNPNMTALFVNLQDAYNSLIHVWNDKFEKRAITLRLSNDKICTYPHHEICIKTSDKNERVVYSHFESKWEFFDFGPIQDFENVDYYKAKRIKDRINNDIINSYMGKLGLEIWTDDFYKSNKDGVYLEQLSWKN